MIVLDTTVLVYAVGGEHPFREPSRQLIRLIDASVVDARTTVEVIQEFVHVRARRRDRDDAVRRGTSYLALLSPLLVSDESHLRDAMTIFRSTPRLGMFDALLAAVAISAGAALVSADRAFSDVEGLVHQLPDAVDLGA